MYLRIDRPKLNKQSAEENLAIVDRWIADTADKLNVFIEEVNRKEGREGGNTGNRHH